MNSVIGDGVGRTPFGLGVVSTAGAWLLEGQLIQMAKQAGAVKLANGTAPDFAKLPEADRADMAFFIEQMRTVLSILDFDLFRSPGGARCPSPERTGTLPSSSSMRSGVCATARELDEGSVVMSGSTARRDGDEFGAFAARGVGSHRSARQ